MKKGSAILVLIFFICNGFLFGQVTNDSLGGSAIYPQFYDDFSAEESWQIHKEAYIKQLKKKGLTASELENKIAVYEENKKAFIENIKEQKKLAAIQRKEAEKLRAAAKVQRKEAEKLREVAAEQRKQAGILRKEAADRRSEFAAIREQAEVVRKEASIQRKNAETQRKLAAIQRKEAKKLRAEAQKLRNSFDNILTKKITFTHQSANIKPIRINVDKKTNLHFSLHGTIRSGDTLVEIFNPKGKKEGELSLEHNTTTTPNKQNAFSATTSGSFNKTISNADIGQWQIKITANKSEGNVNVSVAHYIKPVMNE